MILIILVSTGTLLTLFLVLHTNEVNLPFLCKLDFQRKIMAKSATILFCFIFFMESAFPRLAFSDLIDLPMLFLHFEKHKVETPGISFVQFLSLHYGDAEHVDQDSQNHEKLPFSKNHRAFAFYQIVQYPTVVDLVTTFKVLMKIEGVTYRESSVYSVLTPVWQPPKI